MNWSRYLTFDLSRSFIQGKTNLPVTPEQKGNATPECDDSKSRPNNYKSQKSLPGQETAESTEPGPGQTRKPSLGAVTSLPIPQRSHSQGGFYPSLVTRPVIMRET